jgi:NADH:ubiquinone oxidoreductase subunit D
MLDQNVMYTTNICEFYRVGGWNSHVKKETLKEINTFIDMMNEKVSPITTRNGKQLTWVLRDNSEKCVSVDLNVTIGKETLFIDEVLSH